MGDEGCLVFPLQRKPQGRNSGFSRGRHGRLEGQAESFFKSKSPKTEEDRI